MGVMNTVFLSYSILECVDAGPRRCRLSFCTLLRAIMPLPSVSAERSVLADAAAICIQSL